AIYRTEVCTEVCAGAIYPNKVGSDDALVCCVENTVEYRIMDSGASFHATNCKEELDRFRLHFGKDVRYILGLKRRLILVGQLDEEGYHVGFRDQQ
nr:retrovirus-related Pol polyprotein from transposon TNT 1-94 [Tanacetum cinerariifolium]